MQIGPVPSDCPLNVFHNMHVVVTVALLSGRYSQAGRLLVELPARTFQKEMLL